MAQKQDSQTRPAPAQFDPGVATAILDDALTRYAAARRDQVPDFVRRTYGWRGAARLHRNALGWDLVRAPVNLVLGGVTGVARLGGVAARSAGAHGLGSRLGRVNVLLETDVGREVAWRLHSDLLMIPYGQNGRVSMADAVFDEVLRDPRVTAQVEAAVAAIAAEADKRAFQRRLDRALRDYIGARAPATDITAAFMTAAIGYAAYHKATPGLVSLSSTVAASLSHSLAVSTFWAGSAVGSFYYGLIGAPAASAMLTAGVFAGLAVPAAAVTALAGMVADPIQVASGAHRRRLIRLIDTLEENLKSGRDTPLPLRSHYMARLTDLWDWTTVAYNLTRTSTP
jgi:hypothetical protein